MRPDALSVDEIHEAASRLHSTAWYGRKAAASVASESERSIRLARFSIPRQPTDDDEIVHAAIEELGRLRAESERAKDLLARAHGILCCDDSLEKLPGEIAEFLWPSHRVDGCRPGAWGDPTSCLAHEGHDIGEDGLCIEGRAAHRVTADGKEGNG